MLNPFNSTRSTTVVQPWVGPSSQERWVTVDACRMRFLCDETAKHEYQQSGVREGSNPPLLLIHGLLGYSYSWRHNMAALGQCARVYAIDLPGVGFSDRCSELDCSFGGIAAMVSRALDVLELDTIDLVGTSHGGAVAMMLAAAIPHRIRRLVLVAPVNPWSNHGRWLIRVLATAAGRIGYRCFAPGLAFLNAYFIRRMYGDPSRIAPGTVEAYAAPVRIAGTHDHLLRIIRTWGAGLRQLEAALVAIADIPTLLVWGNRDRAVPISSAQPLRQRFRDVELATIDGAGHLPYEELPAEFNRIVCGFLHR